MAKDTKVTMPELSLWEAALISNLVAHALAIGLNREASISHLQDIISRQLNAQSPKEIETLQMKIAGAVQAVAEPGDLTIHTDLGIDPPKGLVS